VAQNLSAVFPHVGFSVIASVGYPPPWPLLLGLIYRRVYAVAPGFLVYNLAVKIPVIAANVGLALPGRRDPPGPRRLGGRVPEGRPCCC